MKAVCITGMPNSVLKKCGKLIGNIIGTLAELGLEVLPINLMECYVPYYEEGMPNENFMKIANAIRDIKNIILVTGVTDGSPCAVMKVFLEYFGDNENKKLFFNKNVFIITVSTSDGEKEAAQVTSKIIGSCGGFETTRLCIGGSALAGLLSEKIPVDAVEKYAEDYYRMIKQNRTFLYQNEFYEKAQDKIDSVTKENVDNDLNSLRNQVETSLKNTRQRAAQDTFVQKPMQNEFIAEQKDAYGSMNIKEQEISPYIGDFNRQNLGQDDIFGSYTQNVADMKPKESGGIDFDVFNQKQEEDIEELTKLFSTKIKTDESQGKAKAEKPVYERPAFGALADTPKKQEGNDFLSSLNENAFSKNSSNPFEIPKKTDESLSDFFIPKTAEKTDFGTYNRNAKKQEYTDSAASDFMGIGDGANPFGQIPLGREQGYMTQKEPPVVAREKTVKQMTQNLPLYFQSHLAQGTEAVFQFNIYGDEEFSGYLVIKDKDNEYYDGQSDTPDITIIANSGVWKDVLGGKYTAQKAFMTGQLKVRGNFMLLNRFDQLYKKV